jgi:hypothetical protein
LRGDTERVASAASERLQVEADSRKGEVASQAQKLSSALDVAARELGSDGPGWLKSALQQGARSIEQLAQTVEQKDSRQLIGQVQALARQHPTSFLASCAAAGFAAARVFKASGSQSAQSSASSAGPARSDEQVYDPYAQDGGNESRPMMAFTDGGGSASPVSPSTVGTSL